MKVGSYETKVKDAFQSCGVPVAELTADKLKESALVSQIIKASIKGKSILLEEITGTELLKLPNWWSSI